MLTESFVAATENVKPPAAHLSSALKDVGVYLYQFQPQSTLQQGFKKSSVARNCLATSETHIFAAQVGRAVVNVYNREKGNQEATVPFPQKVSSLVYSSDAAVLVLGSQDGRLMLWEVATGRVSTSSASHIDAVTILAISPDGEHILSASPDSTIHIWSIRNLLSIASVQSTNASDGSKSFKDPLATFSQHRSPIQALLIGHAPSQSTNFAVSASEDKVCYIWNLSTLSILRTILLTESPLCAVLDPADRAIYLGSHDGSVQFIDLYEGQSDSSVLNQSVHAGSVPTQLPASSRATPPSALTLGAAQCITCSYDGTTLITGHESGSLIRWDVAKRRVIGEITNLSSQSATNIQMLMPVGFASKSSISKFTVPTVVKPRPDLNQQSTQNGDCPIPAEYILHARVGRQMELESPISTALYSNGFPSDLLGDAIQSRVARNISSVSDSSDGVAQHDAHQLQDLREQISKLKGQVDAHQKLERQRQDWYTEKMKRRDAIGLRKREAFFKAKKEGKNGDEAMKSFEQMEQEIDDEVEQGLHQQHNGTGNDIDVAMAG